MGYSKLAASRNSDTVYSEICEAYKRQRRGFWALLFGSYHKSKQLDAEDIKTLWQSAVRFYECLASISRIEQINKSFKAHIQLGEYRKLFRNEKVLSEICFLVFKDILDMMKVLSISIDIVKREEGFGWLACLTQNFWKGDSKCSIMVISKAHINLIIEACKMFEPQFLSCKVNIAGLLRKYGDEMLADQYETVFGDWLDAVRGLKQK